MATGSQQMLLILIPTIWLSLAVLVVLLCRMAARGDKALAQQTSEQHHAPLPTVTLPTRARWREMPYTAGSRPVPAWAPRARAQRAREGRCVTGS
jgi:hypothetical protein